MYLILNEHDFLITLGIMGQCMSLVVAVIMSQQLFSHIAYISDQYIVLFHQSFDDDGFIVHSIFQPVDWELIFVPFEKLNHFHFKLRADILS